MSRLFTDHQTLGVGAGTEEWYGVARQAGVPQWPVGRRDRGGSAGGPSCRTRYHSAGRWSARHTRWMLGESPVDVRVVDSWRPQG
jgi:hypothetical protein